LPDLDRMPDVRFGLSVHDDSSGCHSSQPLLGSTALSLGSTALSLGSTALSLIGGFSCPLFCIDSGAQRPGTHGE